MDLAALTRLNDQFVARPRQRLACGRLPVWHLRTCDARSALLATATSTPLTAASPSLAGGLPSL
jgi:hypothetical protein